MAGSHLSQWRWSALRPPAHLHLVGVAGVGMSALAQVLLAQGFKVTGSDRHLDAGQSLPVLHKLRRAGVTLLPQNGSAIHPTTSAVVVSTAIEPANPDLAAAHSSGRPVIHRATMLAHLSLTATTLAVAGTAGKTTVTGMIGWALEQAGMDPTVVNGGAVLN
ncbi:MAG: UDP-N-acetylmuramate--alanine ligase, partial [Lentisphaerae bacterium]|nr:UDP-N-acetylmuramate--alanine ligase [Lentisphaerota bacterium]